MSKIVHVRMKDEEFAVLVLLAKQRNISVSELAREKLFGDSNAPKEKRARATHTTGAAVPQLPSTYKGDMPDIRMEPPKQITSTVKHTGTSSRFTCLCATCLAYREVHGIPLGGPTKG